MDLSREDLPGEWRRGRMFFGVLRAIGLGVMLDAGELSGERVNCTCCEYFDLYYLWVFRAWI